MSKQIEEEETSVWRIILSVVGSIVFLTLLIMWGLPQYSVYREKLAGEAELARATQNRQIAIQEAEAKRESAKSLAEAEVIRAEGVARANRIIGNSLKGNDTYLHYLFINNLEHTKDQIIYIPTEANLPILEAGRKQK